MIISDILNQIKQQQLTIKSIEEEISKNLNDLAKNFNNYYYFYIKQDESGFNNFNTEMSFDIPLLQKPNGVFRISIKGVNREVNIHLHTQLEDFKLRLNQIQLNPEEIVCKLYWPELKQANIHDLGAEILKTENSKHSKIVQSAYQESFADFFDKTCSNVIEPYLQELTNKPSKINIKNYLEEFKRKTTRFSQQLRYKKFDEICSENFTVAQEVIFFKQTIEKNEQKIFYTSLENTLAEKIIQPKKKI